MSGEHYGLSWMWPLIGALAFLGLSANEPTALLVVLVVLRSGRGRGAAFVAGWVTALVVVAAGAGFVARLGLGARRGGPRRVTLVIELVIGVALVAWATWYWLHNRERGHSVEVPRILTRLTSIRMVPAFLTGLVTATYPPAIVAGTTLLRSHASTLDRVGGLATFVVVGTLMVAAPVVATYVAPAWAGRRSDAVFDWTLRHRRILLTTILIVVGSFVAARAVLHLTRTGHHRPAGRVITITNHAVSPGNRPRRHRGSPAARRTPESGRLAQLGSNGDETRSDYQTVQIVTASERHRKPSVIDVIPLTGHLDGEHAKAIHKNLPKSLEGLNERPVSIQGRAMTRRRPPLGAISDTRAPRTRSQSVGLAADSSSEGPDYVPAR